MSRDINADLGLAVLARTFQVERMANAKTLRMGKSSETLFEKSVDLALSLRN